MGTTPFPGNNVIIVNSGPERVVSHTEPPPVPPRRYRTTQSLFVIDN